MVMDNSTTLNKTELRLVEFVSNCRYLNNRKAGVTDALYANASPMVMERRGFGAEVAFSKLMNAYPDLTTEPRFGGYDCVLPSGLRVDIKAVTRRTDHLIVPLKKNRDLTSVDAYALMLCETWNQTEQDIQTDYTLLGWCLYSEILDRAYLKTFSTGQAYAKKICELRSPDELRHYKHQQHLYRDGASATQRSEAYA
jgi:hypothetical protein